MFYTHSCLRHLLILLPIAFRHQVLRRIWTSLSVDAGGKFALVGLVGAVVECEELMRLERRRIRPNTQRRTTHAFFLSLRQIRWPDQKLRVLLNALILFIFPKVRSQLHLTITQPERPLRFRQVTPLQKVRIMRAHITQPDHDTMLVAYVRHSSMPRP